MSGPKMLSVGVVGKIILIECADHDEALALADRVEIRNAQSAPRLRVTLDDIAAIRKALHIGAVSFEGDAWFAEQDGYGNYDECEAALKAGFASLAGIESQLEVANG